MRSGYSDDLNHQEEKGTIKSVKQTIDNELDGELKNE